MFWSSRSSEPTSGLVEQRCIYWHKVVTACDLQTVASEEEESGHDLAALAQLAAEVPEASGHTAEVEIDSIRIAADNLET